MDKKLSERILASAGAKKASLVLKHGTVVNVFTAGLEQADIAIEDGCIVGLGDYEGVTEIDLKGSSRLSQPDRRPHSSGELHGGPGRI